MIDVFSYSGADYLRYSVHTPPEIKPEPLKTKKGDIIKIGDKITSIGPKKRTWFVLSDGLYMEYEGIFEKTSNIKYAIFNVPSHNPEGSDVIYKYAFAIVNNAEENTIVQCFLIGPGPGYRDVLLDPVIRYKDE